MLNIRSILERKTARERATAPDNSATVFVSDVRDDIEVWSPELKFSLPINDSWQRSTD